MSLSEPDCRERVWYISLHEIYLAGVSAFWREYLQRFTPNYIFMTAGSILNLHISPFAVCYGLIVYSAHLRETGESDNMWCIAWPTRSHGKMASSSLCVHRSAIIMVWQKVLSCA
jgi:hypothetical protein